MKVLIVVDVQYDFLPGGALAVPQGDQVIPLINKLLPLFELVVATQDWHPKNHLSFASNHPGSQVGDITELQGLPQVLWPDHCVQNTPGARLATELHTRFISHIFQKGTDPTVDSYSGFFDNGHKKNTGLGEYLISRGVTEVYVAGLAMDYCVKFTALDARSLGFRTLLLQDATRAVNLQPLDGTQALKDLKDAGVRLANSLELISQIKT